MTHRPAPPSPEVLLAQMQWLRRLAGPLVHDAGDAEDVAQDTQLAALQSAPEDPGRRRSWLAHVARNFALRSRHRRAQRPERERRGAVPEALPPASELLERVEVQRSVVDAVMGLAEPYRSTILWRYWEDLPPGAIAGRLGIPVATVKTRLRRGLTMLRDKLDGEYGSRDAWGAVLLATGTRGVPLPPPMAGAPGAPLSQVPWWGIAAATGIAGGLLAVALGVGPRLWSRGPAAPAELATTRPTPAARSPLPSTPPASGSGASGAAAGALATRETQTEPDSSGTVSGRVLDDATGEPLAEARVSLTSIIEDSLGAPQDLTAVSGEDGCFSLHGDRNALRRWTYKILAAEHATLLLPLSDAQKAAAETGDVDLGDLRLVRGVGVAGRVVDASGSEGIAGATLLLQTWYVDSYFLPLHSHEVGSSEADGSFRMNERVPPRSDFQEYRLFALTPAGLGWTEFSAPEGGPEEIEVLEIRLQPVAEVHVTVRDEQGLPVAGAEVRAEPRFFPLGADYRKPGQTFFGRREALTALFVQTTDPSGAVTLAHLPVGAGIPEERMHDNGEPGVYDVVVKTPGHPLAWEAGLQLVAGESRNLEITLPAPRTASIQGSVRDTEGNPIAGAELRAGSRKYSTQVFTSGPDGTYRIDGLDLQKSRLDLFASASSYGERRRIVDLPRDGDVSGCDFTLSPLAPVQGLAVDQYGAPVPPVKVTLQEHSSSRDPTAPLVSMQVDTAPDGSFEFPEATEGEWDLIAFPPAENAVGWKLPADRQVQGGDQDLRLTYQRPDGPRSSVTATVVHAATGLPVTPSEAWLYPLEISDWGGIGISPPCAFGRVSAELPPGRWRLVVQAGNEFAETLFEIQDSGAPLELRLETAPKAALEGQVNADGSVALVDLVLRAFSWYGLPGTDRGAVSLDGEGRFRLEGLIPGKHVQLVVAGAGLAALREVVVPSLGTLFVDLDPGAAGTLAFEIPAHHGLRYLTLYRASDGAAGFACIATTMLEGDEATTWEVALPAGNLHWLLVLHPRELPADGIDPSQEGEILLAAGETAVIPVPLE